MYIVNIAVLNLNIIQKYNKNESWWQKNDYGNVI